MKVNPGTEAQLGTYVSMINWIELKTCVHWSPSPAQQPLRPYCAAPAASSGTWPPPVTHTGYSSTTINTEFPVSDDNAPQYLLLVKTTVEKSFFLIARLTKHLTAPKHLTAVIVIFVCCKYGCSRQVFFFFLNKLPRRYSMSVNKTIINYLLKLYLLRFFFIYSCV